MNPQTPLPTPKLRRFRKPKLNVRKANNRAVQQLARDMANASLVRQRPRRLPNQMPKQGTLAITQNQLPLEVGYTTRNLAPLATHRERATERLGQVSISSSTAVGTILAKFMMNPLLLVGTRLSKLAANFLEFRFKRMRFNFVSSVTTAASGAIVMAYCPNPDFALPVPANSTLFAMSGVSANLFVRSDIDARLTNGARWFNLDADSNEVMKTTQGFFAIALDQAATVTGTVTVTIELDYDIEMRGAAIQTFQTSTVATSAAGVWAVTGILFAAPTFTPTLVNNTAYVISPPLVAQYTDTIGQVYDITAMYAIAVSGGLNLFATYDDLKDSSPIQIPGSGPYNATLPPQYLYTLVSN
jgi:hypothetical protein